MDHIGKVASIQLVDLSLDWECHHNIRVLLGKFQHLLNGKAFVVWDNDMLDLVLHDDLLFAGDEISHMPYGHGLIATKIGLDFTGKEPEHFPLCLSLSSYLFS